MRRTNATISVIAALMEDPTGRHWGYELGKRAGVRSGVLYPILRRMYEEGWLEDGWEDVHEVSGRPPRRYYEVTGAGAEHFRSELEAVQTDARFQAVVRPA
jgi:PadR family transcriptional regulator PadR